MNIKSEVTPFCFGENLVRVVKDSENIPWFVGKDIAGALGYSDTDDAIRRHCKLSKLFKPGETPGLECGPRGMMLIPEPDVYRLITKSNLPEAERFEAWVFEEVLPSIRKTGSYTSPESDFASMLPEDKTRKTKNMYFPMAKLVESADESLGGVVALRALNYFTGMPVEDLIDKIETQQIQNDMDFESGEDIKDQMESFLSQRCEFSQAYKTPARDLYQAYTQWCKDLNIESQLSCKRFGMELSARFKKLKSGVIYYLGLRLIAKERSTN